MISTEYFEADAVFEKIYGVWSCTSCDREVRWMKGKHPDQIKVNLLKMEAKWEWI